jgi:hypothetical protein
LTFFLTSLSLYIFTISTYIAYNRFCRDGIYFDKILVSEYKLFKRSNKANLFIALVQEPVSQMKMTFQEIRIIATGPWYDNPPLNIWLTFRQPFTINVYYKCM